MCNLPEYIEEINAKYAKAAKERDEYKKRCAELEAQLAETTKCSDCKFFEPKKWDCVLYPGAHNPDGYCDQGERE